MAAILKRRQMLQGGAILLTTVLGGCTPARANKTETEKGETAMDTSYAPTGKGIKTGKGVGDFDFLTGNWHIRHKRLVDGVWQRFESSASVYRVLGGMGSIEELRNADGSDMGMAVRMWLPETEKWADHWTSAASGIVGAPQFGEFIDGDGVFITTMKWTA